MSKKNKKKQLPRRGQEKRAAIRRRFDITMAGIALLFLVAVLLCHGQKYELGLPENSGYLYWLLLLPAYIPLEIVGLCALLPQLETGCFVGKEALVLGGCDLALVAVVWLIVRIASRHRNTEFILIAWHFAMIFFCWGLMQYSLLGVSLLWEHGGLSRPFHPHLHRPAAPEPVTIVEDVSQTAAAE